MAILKELLNEDHSPDHDGLEQVVSLQDDAYRAALPEIKKMLATAEEHLPRAAKNIGGNKHQHGPGMTASHNHNAMDAVHRVHEYVEHGHWESFAIDQLGGRGTMWEAYLADTKNIEHGVGSGPSNDQKIVELYHKLGPVKLTKQFAEFIERYVDDTLHHGVHKHL